MDRGRIGLLGVCGLAVLTVGGCRSGAKYRSTVEFHVGGVRTGIKAVLREVPRREYYPMLAACDQLARALEGLPVRIEQAGGPAPESQKAAAQKAIALFAQVRPTLESLKYDEAQMKAKMDELAQIIDQVSKP